MPAKRVLISIDERLLARIDEACERVGMSRSAFIARSTSRDLDGGAGPGADPGVRAALHSLDRLIGPGHR
jgi:hypothetical protein